MLKDKVIFITGASSGIGLEIGIKAATLGAIPILTARSLDKLMKAKEKMNGRFDLYSLDVTKSNEVKQVIQEVIRKYGKIDILVNNAGFGIFDNVTEASMSDIEEMINVNYLGMVRCTKEVLPDMLRVHQGHIINIASVAGKIATAKAAAYSASKFAVIGFSNGLRSEVNKDGILISTVNPGPIDTPFFERADPSKSYVSNVKWLMLSSDYVAQKVIDLMITRKEEITMPRLAGLGVKLYHLFPRTFNRLMGKHLNKK